MWPMVAMLALSAYKAKQDQKNAADQQQAAKAEARYSPWTGMKPRAAPASDGLGTMMQGGVSGAMMEQGMDNQANQNDLTKSQIALNNAQANQSAGTAAQAGSAGSYGGQSQMQPNDQYAKYPWLKMGR